MIDLNKYLPKGNVVGNILVGQKGNTKRQHAHNLFGYNERNLSNQVDRQAFDRMATQGRMSLLDDFDGDGVLNVLDCSPTDKNKQDFLFEMGRTVGKGIVLGREVGRGFKEGAVALKGMVKPALAQTRQDLKEEFKQRRAHELKLAREKRKVMIRQQRGRRQPAYPMAPPREKTMFGLRPTHEMFRPRSEGIGLMSAMPRQETKIGTAGGFEMMMGGSSTGGFGQMAGLHGMTNGSKGSLLLGKKEREKSIMELI